MQVNPSVEKSKLNFELQEAKQKDNQEKIDQITRRLAQIESQEKEIQERKAQKTMAGILSINSRAREQNESDLHSMLALQREETKKNIGKEVKIDAFRRRATRPEMSWNSQEEEKKEEKKEISTAKENSSEKAGNSNAISEEDFDSRVRSILQTEPRSGISQSIVPPSRINPELEPIGALNLPQLPAAQRNRAILTAVHSFNLEIDFSATGQKQSNRPASNTIDQKYLTIPPGAKALSLTEYWERRDQEEEMQQ